MTHQTRPGTRRTYGTERLTLTAMGVAFLIFAIGMTVRIISMPAHGLWWVLVILCVLLWALPVGTLAMGQSLGVYLSDEGVTSNSAVSKDFTPWSDVKEFEIGPSGWLFSLTVYLVHQDGRRTALNSLGGRLWHRNQIESNCAALNQELRSERARMKI
jgi:hypothetical protein